MKQIHTILALLAFLQVGSAFFIPAANAQNIGTSELGLGLGGVNYKGEISPKYRFGNNGPAAMLFYRRDISNPVTLRASFLAGATGASDNYFKIPLNQFRQARMSGTLIELAGGLEYNFLDYYDLRRKQRWTPYFFVNVAGFVSSTKTESDVQAVVGSTSVASQVTTAGQGGLTENRNVISISVPAGVGIKFALSYHWNLGAEIGARKIFTDLYDNLGEEHSRGLANPHDSDWYFYNGISLSYTFYKIRCPKVYRSNPTPLE